MASVADVVEVAVVGAGVENSQFHYHSDILLNHDNGGMRNENVTHREYKW